MVGNVDPPSFIHGSNGHTSTNSIQVSAGTSILRLKLQNILSDTGPLEQFGKSRTSLVVENLKISNGKNKTSGHPFSDTNRYIDQRLGSTLQWYLNG